MQIERTNQEWVSLLATQDHRQEGALKDLRDLLLRAALFTLVTHNQDIRELEESDRLALAEDCAQEALHAVLARLHDFRGESKFTTWVYKFGVNVALTRARKERWKSFSLDALSEENDSQEWMRWKGNLQILDSEIPSLQNEVGVTIREAIRTELTGRQQQVLKLIAFDEVPMDVVVELMRTNRNAIYKLLHDARLKIKRKLAALGYEVEEVYNLFRTEA
jgi:RNA polymerase sigma-70 factor (ECF subfamily)